MTGPFDGRPREPDPDDSTPRPTGPRRPLPPELDPRGRRAPQRPPSARSRPAGAPPPPALGKRRFRRFRSWSRRRRLAVVAGTLAVVLLAVFGVSAGVVDSLVGKIHRINPFCTSCNRPSGGATGDLNILVVGSDSRSGLTKAQQKSLHVGHDAGQRSDTMILLHIPAGGGRAVLVSLPRDSYVTIPAYTSSTGQHVAAQKNKLNAAYSLGGAKLTIRTVELNTGVRIDHYVEINFLGFVKMVNALGGVNICSSTAISDPVHYDASTGGDVGSGLELSKGENHLDGDRALEYVRAREFDPAEGDLGRIKRQQKFMGALVQRAKSAGVLLDPFRLYKFLGAVAGSLTTDDGFGLSQIKRLALTLRSMSPSHVQLLTVPLSDTNYASPVGSAVLWDPTKSTLLFHDFTADRSISNVTKTAKVTIAPSQISLEVLNATTTTGLAAKAAAALANEGFSISSTGNAPTAANPAQTIVEYGPTRAQSAQTVAAAVPGATLRKSTSIGSTVELMVGSNYSGTRSVTVSSSSSSTPSTTAADSSC
jgi:LCP family protein required for cell wall assembly